jgi:hypothetical protein
MVLTDRFFNLKFLYKMKYFAAILLVLGVVTFRTTARVIDRSNYQPSAQDNNRAVIMKDCGDCHKGCDPLCFGAYYNAGACLGCEMSCNTGLGCK